MKRNGSTTEENLNDKYAKVSDQFGDTKERLADAAKDIASKGMAGAESVRDTLGDFTDRISSTMEDSVHTVVKKAKQTSREAEKFVKQYPLYTVAGAVAISFVVGMIYGRSNNR